MVRKIHQRRWPDPYQEFGQPDLQIVLDHHLRDRLHPHLHLDPVDGVLLPGVRRERGRQA